MKTDLENIRRLLAAGTKGPWNTEHGYYGGFTLEPSIMDITDDSACGDPECCGDRDYKAAITHKVDADLIITLVNAAPSLIAELEALRAFVQEIKTEQDVEKMETIYGYLEYYHSKHPSEFHTMPGVLEEIKAWTEQRDAALKRLEERKV